MERINVPLEIRASWEDDAMREGISNPHAFCSYIKMREEQYIQAHEEVCAHEQVYDSEGGLTAYGIKKVGERFFAMETNKRLAKIVALEYDDLVGYLSKRGKIKKGVELFNADNFLYARKCWYSRLISRLKRNLLSKEDIPFAEYKRFAYAKLEKL